MSNVAPIPASDRTQELLRELDALRASIAEGTITDYALATVYTDRRVGAQWSKTIDKWRLVGAIENLKIELAEGT